MDFKKIRKSISRFSGWLGLIACSLIIKVLPWSWLYGFANFIAGIGFRVAGKQRRIAMESLAVAFRDELTEAERSQIARQCFEFMAKSAVELLYLMDKPWVLRSRVRIEGGEHLEEALAKKQGVILVSAHFGNFPLLLGRLSIEGYTAGGIMRPMRDSRVERFFFKKRQRLGVKTIYSQPRQTCVDETIKALRNNELVFIPIDQNFGTCGVFFDFFGTKAATATGPAVLAMRTGAAVLPCFIVRQPDNTHVLFFEPAMSVGRGRESVVETIQKLTSIIERYIRTYPAEWGWIHRRWKSRPGEEPA